MTSLSFLYILLPFLVRLTSALNSQNRLVQVWDSIEFFTFDGAEGNNATQGSWNLTSFPYIDGVSFVFCIFVFFTDCF